MTASHTESELVPRHYSEMTTHRRCPQQWMYKSLRRLQADVDFAPVRDFGSWWHAVRAAALIAKGVEEETIRYVPDTLAVSTDHGPFFSTDEEDLVELILRSSEEWWKALSGDQQERWQEDFKSTLPEGLDSLLTRWESRWANDGLTERVLAVEMPWQRLLTAEDGRRVLLEGTVDEILFDSRRDLTVVRDGKTTKSIDQKSSLEDMMDSQLQLYAWGVAPIVKEWGYPQVKVVSYDRCRSITPAPPTLTQSGRLSQRGGEPTVSGTDLQTYLNWAEGPDGDGVPWGDSTDLYKSGKKKGQPKPHGNYTAEEKVVERLKSPSEMDRWFKRTRTPLNPNILRTHLRAALDSAEDIDRTIARVERYGYAQRNLTSSCTRCSFVDLCRAEMVGGAGLYTLADYGLRERPETTQL